MRWPPARRAQDAVLAVWAHPRGGPVIRAVLLYVLVVEVALQLAFGRIDVPGIAIPWLEVGSRASPIPRGVFVSGAVVGTLYAFVGMGLILVYRANRIINFAQAQLGAVPAVIALLLMARRGVPYVVVIPVVLVGGALLGAAVEVLLVRRFADASRLVLTVVTIGIGFLLLVAEFLTKTWISGDLLIVTDFPTPFQRFAFQLGVARLFGDHVVALVVAAAVVIGLGLFFRNTDIGIAVRAAAENRDLAGLLGVPVKRVSTIVWALAGVLSAVAVFLRAPMVGLPLEGFVGPTFLLFGLAAAVIAGMERMPTCLAAGLLIGVVESGAVFATRRSALATAAMLVVIVVALLLQRRRGARAHAVDHGTWETVRLPRAIPPELRDLPEVRWGRRLATVATIVVAIAVPWILGDTGVGFATLAVIYAIVGVSLVVLTGWAGQISLGQFALAGVGAAVAGGLAANHGLDFFVTLLAAGVVGAVAAALLGIPSLRIQGLFLAVTTLAFAFAVQNFFLRREFFGWLLPRDPGFVELPVLYQRLDLRTSSTVLGLTVTGEAKFYLVCVGILGLALGLARSLRRYRSGRVFIGVRDNPRLLQAYGVGPGATRLAAFAASGFIAALAGGLLAYQQGSVDAGTYTPEASIQIFVMTVIGGIGSLAGAVLGSVFVVGVPALPGLRELPLAQVLSSGLGVLFVLAFVPGGLAGAVERVRDAALRRVATRRGLIVPSLLADVRVTTGPDPEHRDDAVLAGAAAAWATDGEGPR
jgi:branched-chain amino acid transport system permease protein